MCFNIDELLVLAAEAGVELSLQDGRLRVRAPTAAARPVVDLLRARRDELLEALGGVSDRPPAVPDPDPEGGCVGTVRHEEHNTTPSLDSERGVVCSVVVCSEFESWSPDARDLYLERLGIADELGLDTEHGTEAELIARREAAAVDQAAPSCRRVLSGVPDTVPAGGLVDNVLAAFDQVGVRLRCVGVVGPGERFPGEPDWGFRMPAAAQLRRGCG